MLDPDNVEFSAVIRSQGKRLDLDDSAVTSSLLGLNPVEANLTSASRLVELAPPESLIDDILTREAFTVLYGRWGTAKSFLALDWSLCIQGGFPWQGRETHQGKVLYVVGEGLYGMSKRVQAWFEEFGPDEIPEVDFHKGPVNLLRERDVNFLTEATKNRGVELVVIDTLNRGLAGGDENSPTHMGQVVMAAEKLQSAGAAVLVIHHTGWNGEFRGHSSVPGAADRMIKVAKADDGTIWLRNTKSKDSEEFQPIPLRLKVVQLPWDTSCVLTGDRWDQ